MENRKSFENDEIDKTKTHDLSKIMGEILTEAGINDYPGTKPTKAHHKRQNGISAQFRLSASSRKGFTKPSKRQR